MFRTMPAEPTKGNQQGRAKGEMTICGATNRKCETKQSAAPTASVKPLHKSMSSDTGPPSFRKPNSALTPEERQAKQRVKKLSKLQSKISKLEKRINHAGRFANVNVAEDSKVELIDLVNQSEYRQIALSFVSDQHQYLFENGDGSKEDGASEKPLSTSELGRIEKQANALITKISNELFLHMYTDRAVQINNSPDEEDDAIRRKRKRAEAKQKRLDALRATKADHQTKAKQMCRAMTKGEQEESMFEDAAALWGYTRQKYVERARLICRSFLKLHPLKTAPTGTELSAEQLELKLCIWEAFLSVDRVCSIGCGPASDVAGLFALKRSICLENKGGFDPPSLLLLDFVIDQWKATILDIALPIMDGEGLADMERIAFKKTDITKRESNTMLPPNSRPGNTLFITSYLLAEQREKWHDYYTSLARTAKSGDIFYFCEPTPWQLHSLIGLTKDWLSFLWVDSSMYFAELQPTDMRAGPAVLVASRN